MLCRTRVHVMQDKGSCYAGQGVINMVAICIMTSV